MGRSPALTPNLTYTPAADYFGPDTFTFKVNDGALDSNVATVTIDRDSGQRSADRHTAIGGDAGRCRTANYASPARISTVARSPTPW